MNTSSASSHYLFNNKLAHYSTLSIVLVFTLYCLLSSFGRGIANAWYFNAAFSLNESTIKDESDYVETLASIKKAHSLDSKHPHYAHMLGRIRHIGVDLDLEDKDKLVEIKQLYLLSTELRPFWPDPWVDLFWLNNYLHGYNDQTKYYIKQAILAGPYVDLVTISTIKVWLLNWSVLSGKERALLFNQFDIATQQTKVLEAVLDFSKKINRDSLLCNQLKFNKRYLKQKESYLYKKYC